MNYSTDISCLESKVRATDVSPTVKASNAFSTRIHPNIESQLYGNSPKEAFTLSSIEMTFRKKIIAQRNTALYLKLKASVGIFINK